ncbi:MAG: hypothetical protein IJH68_02495 [Thermoguttaceae bacterium]|nr:hypothetical protein [Thermoguttaceae bacterium]
MKTKNIVRLFGVLLALTLVLPGLPARAEELNLSFDYGNLPAEKQFLGDIVRTRIAERSDAGTLAVTYAIDTALAPEEFILQTDADSAKITGGDFRALVFGTGALLRAIDYTPERFGVPATRLRAKPDTSHRCCYFARHFHNWYHMATPEETRRYVEDLALWGFNAFLTQIVPTINFTSDPDPALWDQTVADFRTWADSVKRLDMSVASGIGPNQGWRDMPEELKATPNTDPKRGNNGFNVCYSKEGAREYLDEVQRKILKAIDPDTLDYFDFWPFDEGGCECEQCGPWATNGFLRISDEQSRMIEEEGLSRCTFILATWCFHEDEFQAAWKWIEDHPRFKYVLADSHGDFPKYPLEHPLPEGHSLITFPEISMWGRGPWGGYGATALPNHLSDLWHQVRGHVDGCRLYSEGPFEDINKVMESGFYFSDLSADESLRRYARYELCGVDPEDFVALAHDFEKVHVFPGEVSDMHRQTATQTMRRVIKMDNMINPKLRGGWRWRQIYCRAVTDYERYVHGTINTTAYAEAIMELQKLYHSDLFPEGCVDEMHGCVTPALPSGELRDFPRPEEELK